MADQQLQSQLIEAAQSTAIKSQSPPTGLPSASDEKPTSSESTRRRRSSSRSPADASGKPRESPKQRQKAKSVPYRAESGSGSGSSRGSIMTMPGGALDPMGGEITYTPTTHRISKAKKGKKVHACEYPGCSKIFTRAEHRKRHEANHNTQPAFQCTLEGCRKPFQRADLLARHMERQHNIPAEISAFRSPYSQRSTSEASSPSARGSFSGPHMGPPAPAPAPSNPQPSGTMSIGSIIEPNMHRSSEYASHPSGPGGLHELSSHAPIDYLQPQQALPQPFYPQDGIQRPERGSIDSCFQPISVHSPLSGAPPAPAWGQYDQTTLGFAPEAPSLPPHRQYEFHSPSWPDTQGVPSYEMGVPPPQQPWQWTKVNY
ncbi:hypothetical protein HO133_005919 [Letharia lupina]|uniref:C2H2-type domain-containing protein n=1 Tax=Letharia lupina TaxID=560253 RepID=A0A8H6F8I7_9LECA|nr:uncharacterized protein HO133_005919 [Letharia lupina]KAF6218569.1 hypothetical protein HO133_005919 [Letharia lupina]